MNTARSFINVISKNLLLFIAPLFLSSAAHAGLLYNSYADIEFNLVSVSHAQGSGTGPGAGLIANAISSNGSILNSNTFSSGTGIASVFTDLIATSDWSINDPFYQLSESLGEAGETPSGAGVSDAFADTEFSIFVENTSNNPLIFEFSILSFVRSELIANGVLDALDDGGAYAEIFMADSFNSELVLSSAEAFLGGSMFDEEYIETNLTFILQGGESNTIFGTVYSEGYAVIVENVAEPAMLPLLCMGLFGLAGLKRQLSHAVR